jgi:hypothetical protein
MVRVNWVDAKTYRVTLFLLAYTAAMSALLFAATRF